MKKYTYQSLSYLFLTLILGQVSQTFAMDTTIFKLTGKKRYSEGWRRPETGSDNQMASWLPALTNSYNAGDGAAITKLIRDKNKNIDPNEPLVYMGSGPREDQKYGYLIEYLFYWGSKGNSCLKALLDAGVPADGYADYSPLKDLLIRASNPANTAKNNEFYLACAHLLINDYDVDLDKPFPDHNGFGPDESACKGCTARQYIGQKQVNLFKPIADLIRSKPIKPHTVSTQPQPSLLTSTPSGPQIAQQPASSSASTAQIISPSTPVQTNKDMFKPTGKEKYSDGWRGPIFPTDEDVILPYVQKFISGSNYDISDMLQKKVMDPNEPIPVFFTLRDQRWFEYPIEYMLKHGNHTKKSLEALLNSGVPVDGYQDYSPIRHVLELLTNGDSKEPGSKRRMEYLQALIDHGVKLKKQFPTHNGLSNDLAPHRHYTAHEYLEKTKNQWVDGALWQKVKGIFDTAPQQSSLASPSPATTASNSTTTPIATITTTETPLLPKNIEQQPSAPTPTSQIKQSPAQQPAILDLGSTASTPPASPLTQQTTTPAPTSAPAAPTAITAPTAPATPTTAAQKTSWQQWCAQTTSPFAKKTICAMVLGTATVAVGLKMAYKRWIARKPADIRTDLKVTVKNNTGVNVWLTMHKQDGTVIEASFNKNETRSEPVANITQLFIVLQDKVKTSLPINLKAYITRPQSLDSDLEITLVPVTGWWRLWYRSPYRYEAKWQKIK
jgi:hypothetical protein